ncbi:MAG: tRNA (5-methylaminomethyl-2-thiouridine)(34)-methyltransferase MnmD [Saprospiraceae bacterium]|nr:tRNA (5-methylaminomethyl-2-thiouridine)(34)-methyltransferase MnmD [Saprospiraceae bacterium]
MPSFLTEDGSHSFISEQFGVAYHSIHGAIQETCHVFIDSGLSFVHKQNVSKINVLELGFGTGLNALMTYIEAEKLGLDIHYITYEKYPLSMDEVLRLNYPTLLGIEDTVFNKLHNCTWNECHTISPFFSLEKRFMSFEEIDIQNEINLIYFDAFEPETQPQLWEQPMMQKMYDALQANGVLTTYCAKGVVKRTLKSVGFTLHSLPGPIGKREMTRAIK